MDHGTLLEIVTEDYKLNFYENTFEVASADTRVEWALLYTTKAKLVLSI
jgi:hypothetical protein